MKPNRTGALALALLLGVIPLHALQISEVTLAFRTAADFTRLADYLSGSWGSDKRLVARSRPDSAEGLYFRVTLDSALRAIPADTRVRVSIITDASPEPGQYILSLPGQRPRGNEFHIGLTGADWPRGTEAALPVAWKITLLDASGNTLAEYRSFVWGDR